MEGAIKAGLVHESCDKVGSVDFRHEQVSRSLLSLFDNLQIIACLALVQVAAEL